MSNFPVDERNVSFSDDDDGAANLFITQSSFNNICIQDVDDAVDFFGLGDISTGDNSASINAELGKLSQVSEDMCDSIFNFISGEVDNGWKIENDCAPFKAIKHNTGEQVMVGKDEINAGKNDSTNLDQDLKHFSSIVSGDHVDSCKRKRFKFSFYFVTSVLLVQAFAMVMSL